MTKILKFYNLILITLLFFNIALLVTPVSSEPSSKIIDKQEIVEINQIKYYSWTDFTLSRYYVQLDVVDGNAVDFLLFSPIDFTNYLNRFNGESGSSWISHKIGTKMNAKSFDYSFDASAGSYYVVIENAFFSLDGASPTGSVEVHAQIYKDEVPPSISLEFFGVIFRIIIIISLISITIYSLVFLKNRIDNSSNYKLQNKSTFKTDQCKIGESLLNPNFCPKCNNKIESDHIFCYECGHQLKD